jgi:hypothetical protein
MISKKEANFGHLSEGKYGHSELRLDFDDEDMKKMHVVTVQLSDILS